MGKYCLNSPVDLTEATSLIIFTEVAIIYHHCHFRGKQALSFQT